MGRRKPAPASLRLPPKPRPVVLLRTRPVLVDAPESIDDLIRMFEHGQDEGDARWLR